MHLGGRGVDEHHDRDEATPAYSPGTAVANGIGSVEFISMLRAQLDVLVCVLDPSRIVLYARQENSDAGKMLHHVDLLLCFFVALACGADTCSKVIIQAIPTVHRAKVRKMCISAAVQSFLVGI